MGAAGPGKEGSLCRVGHPTWALLSLACVFLGTGPKYVDIMPGMGHQGLCKPG